ncbi:pilus assembly protein [Xanthomonas citri]|uniref:pilus assembly protein n=1 Tax=Xanthomonas citri TaxID=346 RepID=UPI0001CEC402|nr:PilC/PilY family type IV pilus protein [Xanthomonas citri]AMV08924.1 pilus assembly protein [Xanthomonas citri pv. aurantifolii]ARE57319.1 pilus assembly protein [Xanthomonas citri pv. aurantifolii]EFF45550.1 Tfp pilus adhesin [Xanthomonas citri pv. aurantifolii str. ICPB 11122]MCT8354780.1 PilC/PilY family type IV pilus protein [Xanthomonas citri pv. anacardii]MCT8362627.1 PilC/PilY family type IV pilus protein [Xanthomonas citri pv. anacardii]
MTAHRKKVVLASALTGAVGLGFFIYTLIAAQGQGVLAQAPMNDQVQTPPAFIMAVDDSGSMTFQTQFPGQDGQGCWSTARQSFFSAQGTLNTEDSPSVGCGYNHVLPGVRIDENRRGIPPLDSLGFARSAAYNPTYYDPVVKYDPWINNDGNPFPQADLVNTRINPLQAGATVALASNYMGDDFSSSFRIQNGMVLPRGTGYKQRFQDNNGNLYFGNEQVTTSDVTWNGGSQTLLIRFWPATFFVPYTSDTDARPLLAGAAAYDAVQRDRVRNVCGTGCDMWKYTIKATNTDALQNFANWFSFYGNRNRAIIAGMTRSLANVNNMRVGFFRINQNASYDSVNEKLPMRNMGTQSEKTALYNSILALPASGGTPNRQAVNAAGIQFQRTDSAAPVQLACQKNAVMLFTDGYSNQDGPSVSNASGDGNMGIPFADAYDNTMGDIAAKYYNNINGGSPIRADMPSGLVPVPSSCNTANASVRLDCQKNLHVNFYGITLGARGDLFNPNVVQDAYTTPAIYQNWPPRENDERSTVDDIWHAATNTRGQYINARTPAEITQAMRRVLSSVTAGSSPSGTLAQSGARIGVGSFSVAPNYEIANEGTDWFGRLTGYTVSVNPQTRVAVSTAAWEASARMPSAAARNVLVSKAGVVSAFNETNISLSDLCTKSTALYPGMSLCTALDLATLGANAATATAYLRGDASGEVRSGGRLRDRTTVLGDIVNSTPVISSPLDDYGYGSLPGNPGATYQTYLNTKKASRNYMVYVGANDGMLHGFDGGMNGDGVMASNGGVERFAYIPSTALGHMGNLLLPYDPANQSDQKFGHRYYVDGPLAVSDTYYGGAWKTSLVGTAGAGGRSVFAMDVTTPTSVTAASRLWEISDLDSSLSAAIRANIGFVLGKPVIVPILSSNGTVTWKAVFGNGYNSASGKAVLFLVDIKTGTPTVTMIEAAESGSTVSGSNGLGNIVVVDRWGGTGQTERVRDGYADTVYAADQKGAIWKFDLRNTTTALTVPLFTSRTSVENGATYRQPITGGLVASAGENGGVTLFFGTGSFSFQNDPFDTAIQSIYGINDVAAGSVTSTITRSNLQANSIATSGTSRSLVMGSSVAGGQGWYVDLPAGERMVGNPSVASGIVFIPTYVPNPNSVGCASQGSNWLFGLNTRTGGAALDVARNGSPSGAAFASGTAATSLTTQGTTPVKDVGVSAIPRLTPSETGGSLPPGGSSCWMVINVAGAQPMYVPYPCGRQSWRQIQ